MSTPESGGQGGAPLLRPEVFDSPGAADWVRAARAPHGAGAGLLLGASAAGVAALALFFSTWTHTQRVHVVAFAEPVTGLATADCRLVIDLGDAAPANASRLQRSARIWLVVGRSPPMTATVCAPASRSGAVPKHLVVALPAGVPLPVGRVELTAEVERPLLAWVMSGRS